MLHAIEEERVAEMTKKESGRDDAKKVWRRLARKSVAKIRKKERRR